MADDVDIIVIGAGPVGLAAALLLARQGRRVTVYEAKPDLVLTDENSYPIGVNPRGQEALRRIDPALLQRLRVNGETVAGFRIYAGKRAIASLPSGTLIGTTRATLTRLLLDEAQAAAGIRIVTGHKLAGVDLDGQRLTFATRDGDVEVDATEACVICADGVWSVARQAMTEQLPGFRPEIAGWGLKFRVLFSASHASAPKLDPAWHHIFTSKGIYSATLPNGVWCVVVTAIAGDAAETLLLSEEASDAKVAALRAHIGRHAPLTAPLLTDADYRAYFGRQPFGGAVVRCPSLNVDEWLVLLGDAAHSVIPPTGEGVNAGLEDTFLLAEQLTSGSPTPFADYSAARLPDLRALGAYAWHLRDNIADDDPGRAATNVALRILAVVLAALGFRGTDVENRLFGPDAGLTPYRDVIGPWLAFQQRWAPVVSPIAALARALPRRDSKPSTAGRRTAGATRSQPATSQSGKDNGMKLTVIGASSGTGAEVARQAVERGYSVTAVSRRGTAGQGATALAGDATDPAVARRAIEGADAVVVAVGAAKGVEKQRAAVVKTVTAAMQELGVKRIVFLSSLGADGSASQLPFPLSKLMPLMLAKPLADIDAAESVVRNSPLEWTFVRPTGLNDGPGTGAPRALRPGAPGKLKRSIARADVAGYILDCLEDESTIGAAIGLSD